MSARGRQTAGREVWLPVLAVWAGLLGLLAANVALAFLPLGAVSTAAHLAIAGVMVAGLALTFMRLDRASALVRLAAAGGVLWAAFLFLLAGADVVARS